MNRDNSKITPLPDRQPLDASPEAQAEYWLVQLDATPDNPQLLAEFDRWYEADPAHAEAYANAELLWHSFDALPESSPQVSQAVSGPVTPLSPQTTAPAGSTNHWRRWALAACLLLCVSLGGWQWRTSQADLQPAPGTVQRYQLEDGSTLFADSGSRIDLEFNAAQRLLHLRAGRLYIDVAKDGRPLTVVAGDSQVTALGTRFSVHTLGDTLNVAVQESRVQVSTNGQNQSLKAGQQLWIDDGQIQSPQPLGSQQGLAWRKGLLVASNRPLNQVLAELNRYHPDHLLVLDAELAAQRINTVLNLKQPEQALNALLASLQLDHQALGPVRLISRP